MFPSHDQRGDSKTFGEWIYRAIFSTHGSRPFQNVQVDEDYVPLEDEDDTFFEEAEARRREKGGQSMENLVETTPEPLPEKDRKKLREIRRERVVRDREEQRRVARGRAERFQLDPELFKMDLNELSTKERRRLKTYLQDADPTEFFGEEYLKLSKVINTLENIVGSSEEEELEGMDEENLKLIKKLAHLRKRYENLYQDIYEMVYGEEE